MTGSRRHAVEQLSLDVGLGADTEVYKIDESDEHGEVFTRRWVVELILDLAGYTVERDLGGLVAVEPSCGAGAFLVPMVERLIDSCQQHDRPLTDIRTALRAFDLLPANAELAQKAVSKALVDAGLADLAARSIAMDCVRCGDFLLSPHDIVADFVLGNPPYIRLEDVPPARSAAYRRACPTMRGRSDIFVGFIEAGLRLLGPDGVLGFIVADRWMHNQYGSDLRRLVVSEFAVEAILSMHDVDAFEEPVSAYPAVTIIRRAEQATGVERSVIPHVGRLRPSVGVIARPDRDEAPKVVRQRYLMAVWQSDQPVAHRRHGASSRSARASVDRHEGRDRRRHRCRLRLSH
jgi:hypothetical protein